MNINIREANNYFKIANGSSWDRVNKLDTETLRLLKMMNKAPYPEDLYVGDADEDKQKDSSVLEEQNIVDLTKEDLTEYYKDDYLKVYFQSVTQMLIGQDAMKNNGNIRFYKNLIIIYPHLTCFETDPLFIKRCQRKIDELLKKEGSNTDT